MRGNLNTEMFLQKNLNYYKILKKQRKMTILLSTPASTWSVLHHLDLPWTSFFWKLTNCLKIAYVFSKF